MRQLSKNDALFLSSDSATPLRTSASSRSTTRRRRRRQLSFKSLLALVESRLHRSPVFRQKLRPGAARARTNRTGSRTRTSTSSTTFATSPCEARRLATVLHPDSRIHARPLDLNRPLWELYVIEGLDSIDELRRTASRCSPSCHHAAIDVRRAPPSSPLLHDTTPQTPRPEPPEPWFPNQLRARSSWPAVASCTRWPRPGGWCARCGTLSARRSAARSLAAELVQGQEGLPLTAIQRHRLALPGLRDAALPAQRVPRDPPARSRRQDQRRPCSRSARAACAGTSKANDETAGGGPLDADAGLRARSGGRSRQPAEVQWERIMLRVNVATRCSGSPSSRRRRRPPSSFRKRSAHAELTDIGTHAAGGHAGHHGQDARPRAARGRSPRAAGELRKSPTCRDQSIPMYLNGARMNVLLRDSCRSTTGSAWSSR